VAFLKLTESGMFDAVEPEDYRSLVRTGDDEGWFPVFAAPQPQASAEDVALVGRYVTAHKSLTTDLRDAWQRIRASLGVR
jgi:hypothetical protein